MKRASSMLRQDEILDTAILMFKEKGINNVSTRDLTSALGLSRSHIYHYFSNWDLLCLAALSRFSQEDLEAINTEIKNLPPEKALVSLLKYYLPETIDADWLLYVDLWQLAMRNEAYAKLMLTVNHSWISLIEGVIVSGINSGVFQSVNSSRVSRQLGSLINGYADLLEMNPMEAERAQIWDDIMDFLDKTLYAANMKSI